MKSFHIHNPAEANGHTTRGCWTAFRSGVYNLTKAEDAHSGSFGQDEGLNSSMVKITCSEPQYTQYLNSIEVLALYGKEILDIKGMYPYGVGDCLLGRDVICGLDKSATETCRLSIRMFAAITLAGCLTIKAVYMIIVNVRARRRIKTDCLTFGDVIVACLFRTAEILSSYSRWTHILLGIYQS